MVPTGFLGGCREKKTDNEHSLFEDPELNRIHVNPAMLWILSIIMCCREPSAIFVLRWTLLSRWLNFDCLFYSCIPMSINCGWYKAIRFQWKRHPTIRSTLQSTEIMKSNWIIPLKHFSININAFRLFCARSNVRQWMAPLLQLLLLLLQQCY